LAKQGRPSRTDRSAVTYLVLGPWFESSRDAIPILGARGVARSVIEAFVQFDGLGAESLARAKAAKEAKTALEDFEARFSAWDCANPSVRCVREETGEEADRDSYIGQQESRWKNHKTAHSATLRKAIEALRAIVEFEERLYLPGGGHLAPRASTQHERGRKSQPWVNDICLFLSKQGLAWPEISSFLESLREEEHLQDWFACSLAPRDLADRLKPKTRKKRKALGPSAPD
jgi:hypothetical protein